MARISAEYFTGDPADCARGLIGCEFLWKGCSGRIVETEAYNEEGDEACHAFARQTIRDFVTRCEPGDAYVYLNYGIHWLFNIVVKGEKGRGFVLFRALEPLKGIEKMRERRNGIEDRLLTAGPGRLAQALGIGREDNGRSFLERSDSGIIVGSCENVVAGGRIGISKAKELPWRFGDAGSECLSRKF